MRGAAGGGFSVGRVILREIREAVVIMVTTALRDRRLSFWPITAMRVSGCSYVLKADCETKNIFVL